jgi:hypothetical protein
MVNDPVRGLIWVATADTQLGRVIVSLNPTNGAVSEPIVLKGQPGQLAISRNARYLYSTLRDAPGVERIDLDLRRPDVTIELGTITNNFSYYAADIEVLEGDGTSILVSRRAGPSGKHLGLAVFDGTVQRPETTAATLAANRIEATAATNVFIGYDAQTAQHWLRRFIVDGNGVHVDESIATLWTDGTNYEEIRANHSDTVVTKRGTVFDARNLGLKGLAGPPYGYAYPIVDLANQRIFRVMRNMISSSDLHTLAEMDRRYLEGSMDFEPDAAVRWGEDGFAIAYASHSIQIVRWSDVLPGTDGRKLRDVRSTVEGGLQFTTTYRPNAEPRLVVWTSEDLQTWTEQTTGWREEILHEGWDPQSYRESRITIDANGSVSKFVKIAPASD